jgi:hypothetical protein
VLAHEQLKSGNVVARPLKIATLGCETRGRESRAGSIVHGLPRTDGDGSSGGRTPTGVGRAPRRMSLAGWSRPGTLSGVGRKHGNVLRDANGWRTYATILDRVADQGEPRRISLAGFGFGGALALANGRRAMTVFEGSPRLPTPAHFGRLVCGAPEELHRAVLISGVVGNETRPPCAADAVYVIGTFFEYRSAGLDRETSAPPAPRSATALRTLRCPHSDARDLVAAAEGRAELRFIQGCRAPTARRPRGWSRRC